MADETSPLVSEPTTSAREKDRTLQGRRFSRFLQKYIPNFGQYGNLDEAWDYLEHVVLPRRMRGETGGYQKAPPGTSEPTTLYPAWCTPQRDLRDFGTGLAVYFETLRFLIGICLVAWLLYLPTIRYYASSAFSPHNADIQNNALRGSLICPTTEWVPCPTCDAEDWEAHRMATTDNDLVFVLQNACAPLRWQEGLNHLVVLVFLIVSIVGLGYYQTRMELSYDEDVLTASDFSIVINNPPPDATDPEEWKAFLEKNLDGTKNQVVYCTVALDNEDLVAALVKRRAILQKASFHVRDRDDSVPLQQLDESLDDSKRDKKLQKVEAKCRALLAQPVAATAIFVTFETEASQRQALEKLTVAKMSLATNDVSALAPECRFRGNLVLDVEEAKEPSVIRWKDLNETLMVRIMQRIGTAIITVGLVILGFIAVRRAFHYNLNMAAFLIAILNILVPNIFKFVNRLESHAKEGTYQASLYAKISVFRWVNTALVTILIKPFTATISNEPAALIPAIYAVMKAEIVTAPIVHMCDFVGQVKRHILAPRAENQAAMNSFFRGSAQNLGEKYTNMTKIIFLCFFYSVIFPSSFFFGALAIAATYVTDKFLLLRSWGQLPELGDDVAMLSRRLFFPSCLVVLAIVSEFYWSAYPFDNVCDSDQVLSNESYPEYLGKHTVHTLEPHPNSAQVTLVQGEKVYRYCNEDYLERVSALLQFFHEEKDDWMSPDQQVLTFLFGIFCVAVLVVIGMVALVRDIWPHVRGVVQGDFSTLERDSGERFSHQPHIQAYVPQIRHRFFSYPLLACDIDEVEARHIGWTDPLHNHEYYNLAQDVAFLRGGGDAPSESPAALSIVKHWSST